ncbi:MAG: SAM-dependent DNA methyltransferase [Thaumarchaeota archaeon]|nr:SAM-dependent DNA methyltransferase [Nitrososphaerota archaeon]
MTNSTIGALNDKNLPTKSNFKQLSGLDALTGKSNFDISEWMLIHLLKHLTGHHAVLAMLCKTSVARKVLHYSWAKNFSILKSSIYSIDAFKHFGVAVDACLLVIILQPNATSNECTVYSNLDAVDGMSAIGLRDGCLIADLKLYVSYDHLSGTSSLRWRSGIKHDCARVMELRRTEDGFVNKLGEHPELESTYIYPFFKSSHLANTNTASPHYVIVTQQLVGEDTAPIKKCAPKTWSYLQSHKKFFERRASTVYKNKPSFSIFGVGKYSFASWKVAISGFYKRLNFCCVGPVDGKPTILDDTCYFMPCQSRHDAVALTKLLNSESSKQFFASRVFWDTKRPITAHLLSNLNLEKLATEAGMLLTHKKGIVSVKNVSRLE